MSRRGRRRIRSRYRRAVKVALCVALVFAACVAAAVCVEEHLSTPVENAGQQLTAYKKPDGNSAQYFVNGQWVVEKELETLLVIGIDDFGAVTGSDSYNNSHQADFMVLLLHDPATGENQAIHINRDTMTAIPVLGVTGQKAGTRYGQLALAYTYGKGREDSCRNTVDAVSNLLYGIEIDHYITVTMDAVPILNDWAGGVELTVLDDFSGIDDTLILGKETTLYGEQALRYVRSRMGLDDSSNLHRMERQRQYAMAWLDTAQPLFSNVDAMLRLVMELENYYFSDCTASELTKLMDRYAAGIPQTVNTVAGESVQGSDYMEYYADEEALEQMVVELFYRSAE